jgi:hypothetical protein
VSSWPSHRIAGVLGWAAVAAIALGVALGLVPVDNPGVQSCGAPLGFLVSGELDRFPDATGRLQRGDRVVTLDPAQRRRAVESPCSERVERRAIPAGLLVVGGSVMGLTAVTIGIVGAWRRAGARARHGDLVGQADLP